MLKDITLGQFFPGESIIHRMDPRVKIIVTILYIVTLFLAQGPVGYALMIADLAAIILISRINLKSSRAACGLWSSSSSLPRS